MARIYVSSTFSDLEEYRKEVSIALRRLGHEDVAMEYYVAEDMRPLERCLADVASCDVYVGIFAWRHGYVPPENNPEGLSITELEYRKAQAENIKSLIFLLSIDAPWPMSKLDEDLGQIRSFRKRLSERHLINDFKTSDELTRKINEAVVNWEKESGQRGKRELTDWDAYRQAVVYKHRWVRLQVIAGVTEDQGRLQIPLTEVFEPQLVTAGASGKDIPDEVRKGQEEIYGGRRGDDEKSEPEIAANPELMLVLDMLAREPTQVILGGPGSGKSTIFHYAMLRVCQDDVNGEDELPQQLQGAPIPFLIELRNYVIKKHPDFITHIIKRAEDYYGVSIHEESLRNALAEKGRTLVFFDGLDEVFDPIDRQQVIEQFQAFAHRYPETRIVVTSRIAGYNAHSLGLTEFTHYTLQLLTLTQIRRFADQWYKYFTLEGTDRTALGLIQRIIENPRLLDLAGNPMLLTMMAVRHKQGDLPQERWDLYERCANTLLQAWDMAKQIKDEEFRLKVKMHAPGKSEILQRVSMYMMEHGQTGRELNAIGHAPLHKIVTGYLEEKHRLSPGDAQAVADDILRHLSERTYVLAGIGERVFGFVHRTFMEYFAAYFCKMKFNALEADYEWLKKEIFGAHWESGDWEEILLLLAAMVSAQGTHITQLVEYLRAECKTTPPYNVAFAAQCMGEAGIKDQDDQTQAQSVLEELAQAITEYAPQFRKEEARRFVDHALGAFASLAPLVTAPPSVEKAIDSLNQSSGAASRRAAWQMGFALQSLKGRLAYALAALKDAEEVVRSGAIAALEREWPGRHDIGPALSEVVSSDRNARVRQSALAALQRSWPNEPAILDAIASRVDEKTGYRDVIKFIEYLSKTWSSNPKARDVVMKLAARKQKARVDYDQSSVMRAAGEALAKGWKGDEQALAFLQDTAKTDPERFVRKAAIEAIPDGWSHSAGALQMLKDVGTADAHAEVRAAALKTISLGWHGYTEAQAFLFERATVDPVHQTRAAAVYAIGSGWRGDAQALTFLQERATADESVEVREAVFGALAQGWAGQYIVRVFLEERAVNDSDPRIRAAVFRAMINGWSNDQNALTFLKERVSTDPEPQTRIIILHVIARELSIPNWRGTLDSTIPNLLTIVAECAVNESNVLVRATAVQTLSMYLSSWLFSGWYDQSSTVRNTLSDRASSDPDPNIRLMALVAIARRTNDFRFSHPTSQLKKAYNENFVFLEQQAVENPEPVARAIALWIIADGSSPDPRALDFLMDRALNDPDELTRFETLKAICWGYPRNSKALSFLSSRETAEDLSPENQRTLSQLLESGLRNYSPPQLPEYSTLSEIVPEWIQIFQAI